MLYTTNELKYKAQTESPSTDWLKELYAFIDNWFNNSDYIEVKTSGSTGLPKAIRHSKRAMLESAAMTCDFLNLQPGMHALLCMNTRSIAGMMMVVRAIERQMKLIIVPPDGHPLRTVQDTDIHFAAMVPAQAYNSLRTAPEKDKLQLIEHLIVGGAPVNYALQQEIRQLKGNVYATFGMTETMSHIAMRRLNGAQYSDEYKLLKGISIETGKDDNLIVYAPYLGNKPLVTNDIVKITGTDSFLWLGRMDHVINCGGFKIYPEKLEERIAPYINCRYFIAAEEDDKSGQVPVLIVEMARPVNHETWSAELLFQLSHILPRHELPRKIYYAERFIETPTHKIIRSASLKRAT